MNQQQQSFVKRWFKATWNAIWSLPTLIIFILGFIIAEVFWWKFYSFGKAWEQALENFIPVASGAIITLIVIAIIQLIKVRALINKENDDMRSIIQQKEDEVKQVSKWLSWHLFKENLGVNEAYLFGSITHNNFQSNDVDLVLLFKEMKEKDYTRKVRRLIPIAHEFKKMFGKKLHYQRYLASESYEFERFVSRQSEPILLLRCK